MAPGYRSSSRRHNRTGLNDHDVYEGLPVRQWRRGTITVAPSSAQDNITAQSDIWAIELPYGMPKDSHLLPQHSQELLRAARSGKIYKRSTPAEEEEPDLEATHGIKLEKKDDPPQDRGFTVRTWKQIPRHLEVPDEDFLARRRKESTVRFENLPNSQSLTASRGISQKLEVVSNEPLQVLTVTPSQADAETDSPHPATDLNGTVDRHAGISTPLKRKGVFKKKINVIGRSKRKRLLMTSSSATNNYSGSASVGHEINGEQDPSLMTVNNEEIEICGDSLANVEDWDGDDVDENDIDIEEDDDSIINQGSPSKLGSIPSEQEVSNFLEEKMNFENITTPEIPKKQDRQGSLLDIATQTISTVVMKEESHSVAEFSPRIDFLKESSPHNTAQGLEDVEIIQEIKQEIISNETSALITEDQSVIPEEVCTTTTISDKSIIFSVDDAKNTESITIAGKSTSLVENYENVHSAGSLLERPASSSPKPSSTLSVQNLALTSKSEETCSEPMQGIELEVKDPLTVSEITNNTNFPDFSGGAEAPS